MRVNLGFKVLIPSFKLLMHRFLQDIFPLGAFGSHKRDQGESQETFTECQAFISWVREARHRHVWERQVAKCNRLWLRTLGEQSKEHSGSGGSKENGYT